MARKKHGSDELLAPDAFQQQGSGWVKWLETNIRLVLIGIAVVLVGVVGTEFVVSQSARSASATTAEFGAALEKFQRATDPGFAQTATSTEIIDKAEREARQAFADLRAESGAAGPQRLTLLYEADLARRSDDHAAAAALYVDYLDRSNASDPLRFIALEGAGYAHESIEDWDAALGYFRELETVEFYAKWALKHQARVLAAKGDSAEAAEVLQRLIDSDPGPFLKNHAENQLKLVR